MTKLMRTQGFENGIWQLTDKETPDHCPECNCKHSLIYIGYAQNYNHQMQAKIYQCTQCDSWLDVVWPKQQRTVQTSKGVTKKFASVGV